MGNIPYAKVKLAVDSVIFSGVNFTLEDIYGCIEEYAGEKFEWISGHTSVEAHVNDLVDLKIITPIASSNTIGKRYKLNSLKS